MVSKSFNNDDMRAFAGMYMWVGQKYYVECIIM